MKVLVVGSGGREHALAWKLMQSAKVSQVFVAPGNAGTALETGVQNIDIASNNLQGLLEYAQQQDISLTIIGPEVPLVAGIVDLFNEHDLPCFGPSAAAAQLEGSKTYAKSFMDRHAIPTAQYKSLTDIKESCAYADELGYPCVIKADGLAAGKGVIIANSQAEAHAAIQDMLEGNRFGDAGHRVVIEEFLQGEEASFICMVDGQTAIPLATSQDHKARDDGDNGPNTGGMGAYSPAPLIDDADVQLRIMEQVIQPTIDGMAADGNPFTGFLYAGLMIDNTGKTKVLEFNVRFGDPETQPVMMRLESDLFELCLSALNKDLHNVSTKWSDQSCIGIVVAANGYPDNYPKGDKITGIHSAEGTGTKVFHAGTIASQSDILTNGGRVLCVCALGNTLEVAQHKAYQGLNKIQFDGMYFRHDIGFKAI